MLKPNTAESQNFHNFHGGQVHHSGKTSDHHWDYTWPPSCHRHPCAMAWILRVFSRSVSSAWLRAKQARCVGIVTAKPQSLFRDGCWCEGAIAPPTQLQLVQIVLVKAKSPANQSTHQCNQLEVRKMACVELDVLASTGQLFMQVYVLSVHIGAMYSPIVVLAQSQHVTTMPELFESVWHQLQLYFWPWPEWEGRYFLAIGIIIAVQRHQPLTPVMEIGFSHWSRHLVLWRESMEQQGSNDSNRIASLVRSKQGSLHWASLGYVQYQQVVPPKPLMCFGPGRQRTHFISSRH